MNCITASCRISGQSVSRNGDTVFENKDTDLPDFLLSGYQYFSGNYPKFYKMDNLSKLGWLAAEVLLKEGFLAGSYRPEEIGITLANANSSLDTDLKYFQTVKEIPSPALFVYTLPNIMIGEICIRHHIKGESACFISPGFDADFMEWMVNDLMDNNELRACICGWVDLLKDEHIAVLYLVEKETTEQFKDQAPAFLSFKKENINKIFQG